ncbi:unnamed protein product [Arctia plantaginis]|uniref:Uncharacterized protein n=1 Tax=Arctia plantaginis TaxID=874455 RepID=A0A8S1BFB7_ARCPL|nr:unnamed protein product [Arctia plantaginis]
MQVTVVRASPEPRRAPSILEPPHHVEFTNDSGTVLSCATRGDYQNKTAFFQITKGGAIKYENTLYSFINKKCKRISQIIITIN